MVSPGQTQKIEPHYMYICTNLVPGNEVAYVHAPMTEGLTTESQKGLEEVTINIQGPVVRKPINANPGLTNILSFNISSI